MTPAEAGYFLPAEWQPHLATWVAWPHQKSDWPGKHAAIPWVFAEVVRHLHTGELVRVLVNDPAAQERAVQCLQDVGVDPAKVEFFQIPTDRCWTRDYIPTFLTGAKGQTTFVNWFFNAWAKYPDWKLDDAVADQLRTRLNMKAWIPSQGGRHLVLEGGAIDVNGEGLLLTTEECLLSDVQTRNPGFTRAQYEGMFAGYLGVSKVLWLGQGIDGDDTHGHVDDLARFVAPRTVVAVVETNRADPNHEPLRDNLRRLKEMSDKNNKPLEIVELPMPDPIFFKGQRLPASYANFYIGNEKVLVPTFNDRHDRAALGILADLFPGRTVVGIHAVDLVWGLGTIHCMTHEQPAKASVEA